MNSKTYIAIDLKSFYASVECVERGLNPLTTNLVVADSTRTEKTICLAVTPSLKSYGISGRARLFEVIQQVNQINKERLANAIRQHKAIFAKNESEFRTWQPELLKTAYDSTDNAQKKPFRPRYCFAAGSYNNDELTANDSLELTYIIAPPRMALYLDYSTRVYGVYLNYIAPEDIHVYSVDECFIDVTPYLATYGMTAHELAVEMIHAVLRETGITATCGIGSNLYLAKVAMDIVAKHSPADKDGVRIAELDEVGYREKLWDHTPLTDFWRIGRGISSKLARYNLRTQGDIALCSRTEAGEDLLFRLFGINAELLIDHAWGYEPCTIDEIRQYKPKANSISSGQVLMHPYTAENALLIVKEMADQLALQLTEKGLLTEQLVLWVCSEGTYDAPVQEYNGSIHTGQYTACSSLITKKCESLYCSIIDWRIMVRRIGITACNVITPFDAAKIAACQSRKPKQLSLFQQNSETAAASDNSSANQEAADKETRLQETVNSLKKRFGSNCILKGMNLMEEGTTRERNMQIGGHRA